MVLRAGQGNHLLGVRCLAPADACYAASQDPEIGRLLGLLAERVAQVLQAAMTDAGQDGRPEVNILDVVEEG